jgi:PTH1 family peptidyl-tRNA hydrolase
VRGEERRVPPSNVLLGLGNPGPRYERTRHNAGFRVADALARGARAGEWRRERAALVTDAEIAGRAVLVAKPLTFMNRSGDAARALLEERGLGPEALIVIGDDLNLPLGKVRVRPRGSSGGQLGLESVLRACGTDEIVRVRLGVGEEAPPEAWRDFVLEEFPAERLEEVERMVARARDAVEAILADGVARAMSVYNA